MILGLNNKNVMRNEVVYNPIVTLLMPVEVADKSGRIVRRSEFKPFDLADNLKKFKSEDFSVTSLQSVGALDTLKSTFMSHTSSMNVADSFENLKLTSDVQKQKTS